MKTNLFTAAIGLSIAAYSYTIHAQQDLVPDNTKIETITVLGASQDETALLGGVNLNELPLSAHIVDRTEIERIRFVDPNELLDRIPGETQVRNLRIPNGGKSYTLAFVDGVPIESPYEGATQRLDRVNTFDIQRVEIIKGQASALYPNNVFGGVVNVVTRDIPQTTESAISAELGNFGRHRLGFNIGSHLGGLGYMINANNRRVDGLRKGTRNNRDAASIKLVYELNDLTRITARLEQLEEDTELRGDLSEAQLSEDPRQAGGLSSATDLSQDTSSISIAHKLERGEIKAVALARNKKTIGLSRFRGPQDEDDQAVNVNASYRHDLANGSLVAGLDTYRGDVETKAYDRADTQLQGEHTRFATQLDINAYFAQYHVKLIDGLALTTGLRYEKIDLSSDLSGVQQISFDDLAPKLGFNYQLTDNTQIWVSVADGFYAPSLDSLYNPDDGNPNLKPEQARNIEFGLRGDWKNWAYDTSIYLNEISNYLVTQEFVDVQGNDFERVTNAGQVTVQGIESVIEYAPEQANWRVGLTHTYADNEYDSFVQSTPNASDDFSGNQLARSPKHHLNARFAWEPITNFTAELEGDFYSSYFSDDANSVAGKFKRDERINLRLSYEQKHWRVWLNVLNISDTLKDRATFRRGDLSFRTVDGRTYYAGVSYNF